MMNHTATLYDRIGIQKTDASEMITILQPLLAGYQVYYQNLRGLHWNIRGKHFFELHQKFEELYTDAAFRIDELAERILSLGGTPLHTFYEYLDQTEIKPASNVRDANEAVQAILANIASLLVPAKQALQFSEDIRDEGTNALISEIISTLEKNNWMFSAWLDA